MFEKRDGAIIHQLRDENEEVVTDRNKIDQLLAKTITEIQVDSKEQYIEEKEFPKLPELSAKDFTLLITNKLTSGKAIAHDCLCDSMFKYHIKEEELNSLSQEEIEDKNPPARILKKVWSTDLDNIPEFKKTWEYRLCALNKIFPRTPNRYEMRPINIGSPILKALEARFLPSLKMYLRDKLDRAQTGFIDNMGIYVNLQRAIQRIQLRTNGKPSKVCYGLFIDFSNAYNMVPHKLLFEKLRMKEVLPEEEIKFLEQIYARLRIRIGKNLIRPNRGVAQGSIISPALFNIFVEDLSSELQDKAGINLEDLLFYADDLLTLCTSQQQLRKAIQVIKKWSSENGMVLNSKKSGIVVFVNRMCKSIPLMKSQEGLIRGKQIEWIPTQKEFEGFPICSKYKYLGTWLNNKLTVQPQINHIKKKAGHILTRLYPYLHQASADGRRDMWMTMIKPLFGALFPTLEGDKTNKTLNQVLVLWKMSFKSMMLIPKRTGSQLIEWMIGKELVDLCAEYKETSLAKWISRKLYQPYDTIYKGIVLNPLQGVPSLWCNLLRKQVSPCKICLAKGEKAKILRSGHLYLAHGIRIMSVKKIFKGIIEPIVEGERNFGMNKLRRRITSRLAPVLELILSMYEAYNL